jgi:hypothetical protein
MNPNITTIQDPLALAIRNDLAREATNRQEWIAIKVSLCRRHDKAPEEVRRTWSVLAAGSMRTSAI